MLFLTQSDRPKGRVMRAKAQAFGGHNPAENLILKGD
nr:MAG TPA: hypothetical protein [Caudoviricetes sp.]